MEVLFFLIIFVVMRINKYPKIIKAFRDVVSALESRNVYHDPQHPATSNMGLMTQALMGWTEDKLRDHFYGSNFRYKYNIKSYNRTRTWWAEWTRQFWPMNGRPHSGSILARLYDCGLSRDDIADIEYLNNKIINKLFDEKHPLGTKMVDVMETKTREVPKKVYRTIEWKEEHYRSDWWGKLWGLKKTVIRTEKIEDDIEIVVEEYEEKVGEKEVPMKRDSKNAKHVIIYFNLWADHMQEVLDDYKKREQKVS